MVNMFRESTAFNQDVGSWDVSSVTGMSSMFFGASLFNQDVGNWDVSNVTRMWLMFSDAANFNQDLGAWDLSSIQTGTCVYANLCSMLNGTALDCINYSNTLIGWSSNAMNTNGLWLGASGLVYNNADIVARDNLISNYGWSISGDALTSIGPTFSFTDTISICQGTTAPALNTVSGNGISGTWNPATIDNTTSGTYVFTPAPSECALADTLNVVIIQNSTGADTLTACDSYTVPSGDETYTASGTYLDTIPNALGCDSIITIDLTINNSSTGTDTQTACDSYTWIDGNTYTASNNIATHTLTNAAGCDSIVTLNLTIYLSPTVFIPSGGSLCVGTTLELSASSEGEWTIKDPSIASIDASGLLTGQTSGSTSVIFKDMETGCLSDSILGLINVNTPPNLTLGAVTCDKPLQTYVLSYTVDNNQSVVTSSAGDVFLTEIEGIPNDSEVLMSAEAPGCPVENISFTTDSCDITLIVYNGVSPNGDGVNDYMVVEDIEAYPNNKLSIYNRYGDIVYQASPYNNDWEGQNNIGGLGADTLTAGTYMYVLELGGDKRPIKGFIELKR